MTMARGGLNVKVMGYANAVGLTSVIKLMLTKNEVLSPHKKMCLASGLYSVPGCYRQSLGLCAGTALFSYR